MQRRILWVIIATALTSIAIGGGAALAMPPVRHIVSGLWNLPDGLPALAGDGRVHYQPGAEDYAHEVAALLPAAMAQVEAVHGRPFAHPPTVGAYTTMAAYAAANGLGSTIPMGVTFVGQVNLSPKLFRPQHQRLRTILTHELSHAHIAGWIGWLAYIYLPTWFKEGMGVMVSEGGGAELVSEAEARAAMRRGETLVIDDAGSLKNLGDVRLQRMPANKPAWYPVVLAYREAGMFVCYLRESDARAFNRMMNAILNGRPFAEAVITGYHDNAQSLWQKFSRVEEGSD